jgi:hypothetical protein
MVDDAVLLCFVADAENTFYTREHLLYKRAPSIQVYMVDAAVLLC